MGIAEDMARAAFEATAGEDRVLDFAPFPLKGDSPGGARIRLRFDKVVVGLVGHLEKALSPLVPDKTSVLVTVTAPIRIAGKTAVALEEDAKALLARGQAPLERRAKINGNRTRIRVVRSPSSVAPKVLGFVHNADTDPALLLDLACGLIEVVGAVAANARPPVRSGERCIVLGSEARTKHAQAYRYIWSRLRLPKGIDKRLRVLEDGRLRVLNAGRKPQVGRP
jgi:hypothetical protein